MAMFRQYVLSLTAAALLSGILLSFFHEGVSGKILRLVCGILLTVTALQPLRRMELPDMNQFIPDCRQEAEDAAAWGQEMAESKRIDGIRQRLEAYILDKAAAMGLDILPDVILDASGVPAAVCIEGELTPEKQQQLQTVITNDLGIPGEAQKWITKKEKRH